MARLATVALLVVLGFAAVGCVSQSAYDDLQKVNRTLEEQIVDLKLQLEQAQGEVAFLRKNAGQDNAQTLAQLAAAQARADRLQQQLAAAQAALADAERRLRNIPTDLPTAVLPTDLDSALRKLAAQYPGLMTYDPALGMIKLESDLTFALGSTEVSAQARQALDRLASVLGSPVAQPFEIRVVGHTDNVPVRNPVNVKKYGDNWGLSVFRAIAVKDVLQKDGISPGRFMVAGYGEYHPIVPNGAQGARQNRRVEIYLFEAGTPSVPQGGDVMEQPAADMQPAPAPRRDEPVMYK